MHTPDREINPPNGERFKSCFDCNGTGKIWEPDEDGEEELITCPTCKGDGIVENDEGGEEW